MCLDVSTLSVLSVLYVGVQLRVSKTKTEFTLSTSRAVLHVESNM